MTAQPPQPAPAIPLDAWATRGARHRIFGHEVFAIDTGPTPGGAAEIPGARTTWLDDLGHYPMLEAPDRWAAAALAFIDGLAP